MTQLSKYITVEEFEHSQTGARLNITNKMTYEQRAIAQHLAVNVLDVIRDYYGVPLLVSSGYRSRWINVRIGGADKSQHMIGEGLSDKDAAACDFNIAGKTPREVFDDLRAHKPVVWDQLILEFDEWVHISSRTEGHNRGDILHAYRSHGRTIYESM